MLKGGNDGSKEDGNICIITEGGKGGDRINVSEYLNVVEEKLDIFIEDNVEIIGGNGGNSVWVINDNWIGGAKGGNGGNIIDTFNVMTELKIGDIKGTVGIGGKGGCEEEACNDGENGKYILGKNITYIEEVADEKDKIEDNDEDNIDNKADFNIEEILENENDVNVEEIVEENEEIGIEEMLEEQVDSMINEIIENKHDEEEKESKEERNDVLNETYEDGEDNIEEEKNQLDNNEQEKEPNFIIRFFRWLFGKN